MGSSRNTCFHTPDQSLTPHPQQTRASLPPKPVTQKRTRNTATPTTVPASPNLPHPVRPRRSWTRRSASWTPEEDAKLIELVRKETSVPPSITASKTWSRVAAQLTKRTGKQCRERYLNQLKPGIRRDPWSPEEERILHEAHARYGNKWVTIASQLPGRTDNCVKNHWNSMLRKRQRREAALRAAQDGRSSKVTSVLCSPTDRDLKGDAEHSVYTGCATPSGASSSIHDIATSSGVPSPFTASSPITPKRNVKLQISSLVAASSKEMPAWSGPYLTQQISSTPQSPAHPLLESGQAQVPTLLTGSQSPVAQGPNATKRQTRSTSAVASNPNSVFLYRDDTQDGEHLSLPCSEPLEVRSLRTTVDGDAAAVDIQVSRRQLRRSARLTSASTDKSKGGTFDWTMKPSGIKKSTGSKGKRRPAGTGNPLAALAAAASSVPPSPLTPESRFSGTSRSRSVSPPPRAQPDVGKANCRGISPVKLITNADVGRLERKGSFQAKRLESSGNNYIGRPIRGETVSRTRNGVENKLGCNKQRSNEIRHGTEDHSHNSGSQGCSIEKS